MSYDKICLKVIARKFTTLIVRGNCFGIIRKIIAAKKQPLVTSKQYKFHHQTCKVSSS